jgi:general L-amino acid transport system substrate-binding protein
MNPILGPLTAALFAFVFVAPALAGKDLDAIRKRGELICGVSTGVAGFSAADSQGRWTGLDADICRAVAAAVLKDGAKVRFAPLAATSESAYPMNRALSSTKVIYGNHP